MLKVTWSGILLPFGSVVFLFLMSNRLGLQSQRLTFLHVCARRTFGTIYIPYCHCVMLLVLLACLTPFYVSGDAILFSP